MLVLCCCEVSTYSENKVSTCSGTMATSRGHVKVFSIKLKVIIHNNRPGNGATLKALALF